jgi:transcriptional regulator with XRE-family HTH domain
MAEEAAPRHFLRSWRTHRGYSLETVAERVGILGAERQDAMHDPLSSPRSMTHASLSRIERGLQPYNQALLEILADVYQTDVASLLIRDPMESEGLWSIWDQIPPTERVTALAMLRGLVRRTGTNG